MKHLESARDKVLMGPERKARLPDEEANRITAYHEGGHAIVAYYTKVSIYYQNCIYFKFQFYSPTTVLHNNI